MKKRLLNLFKVSSLGVKIYPFLPYILIGIVCVAGGLTVNKVVRQWSYKKKVQEDKFDYNKCLKKATNWEEVNACYHRIK